MTPTTATDPWQIDAAAFPHDGTSRDRLEFALRYAILAPSAHNTQPWRFRIADDTVEIHADRLRALPVADPDGRELALSCGAALFFLRIALRRFGHTSTVAVAPSGGPATLLARLRLGEPAEPTADEAVLAQAIVRRHTSRGRFEERPVSRELVAALTRAALAEGAWMEPVADAERKRALAGLVAQAHARQLADPAFAAELSSWIRDPAAEDGMPGHGVALDAADPAQAIALTRTFEDPAGAAATEQQLAAGSPLLAVLGTDGDGEADWVRCGEALGHVLLRAYSEGLVASFLNQPIEVAAIRPHVTGAIGRDGFAQVVLRLGHGPAGEPSPRRPLADVLMG